MTIEAAIESAYLALLRAQEPTLAAVRVNRASAGLAQTGAQSENGEIPFEQKPLPCITLTATRGEEDPPASGVCAVALEIECEASDQPGGDFTADSLFQTATRPLLYVELVQLLNSSAAGNAVIYGLPRRMDGMTQEIGEATFIRTATATIICSPT